MKPAETALEGKAVELSPAALAVAAAVWKATTRKTTEEASGFQEVSQGGPTAGWPETRESTAGFQGKRARHQGTCS